MKKHIHIVITCLLVLACVSLNAQQYIYAVPIDEVSPTGGDGTIGDPWDLQTGLDNIQPGQTLYLRDGIYHGRFNTNNTANSTSTEPKKVTSYPGEWAILDGNVNGLGNAFGNGSTLTVTKPYMWFMNFELTFLGDYSRATEYEEGNGCVKNCSGAINHHSGIKCKFINLVIREHPGNGIWTTKASGGLEIYGCLIYNNGNEIPTNPGQPDDGSGIYAQNSTDYWDNYNNNLFFNNFKVGAKMYSASRNGGLGGVADYIKNLNFEDNTILNSGSPINLIVGRECFIVGSNSRIQGRAIPHHINVRRNFMYHNRAGGMGHHAEAFRIGQELVGGSGPLNGPNFYGNYANNINVEDNYILGRSEGLRLIRVGENFNFKRNVVRSAYVYTVKNYALAQGINTMTSDNWHFEDNHYFTKHVNPGNDAEKFLTYGIPGGWSTNHKLSELQTPLNEGGEFGIESASSTNQVFTNLDSWLDASLENSIDSRKTISIVQNFYNPNRFKIVAYDINHYDVIADLSNYNIPAGTSFTIRDGENYFDIIEDYGGAIGENGLIKLPMGLTILDIPNGEYPSKAAGIEAKKSNLEVGVFIVDFGEVPCEPDLVFQDETETGTEVYEAGNSIITAGSGTYFNVNPGADITHKAGNFVLLQDGTHIKEGSNYLAEIQPCSSTELDYVGEIYTEPRKGSNQTKEDDLKDESNKVKVSPNPATTKIIISSSEDMSSLTLSNTLGRTVIETTIREYSSLNTELNLSGLPSGMYFLKVTLTSGETITKQIIKK